MQKPQAEALEALQFYKMSSKMSYYSWLGWCRQLCDLDIFRPLNCGSGQCKNNGWVWMMTPQHLGGSSWLLEWGIALPISSIFKDSFPTGISDASCFVRCTDWAGGWRGRRWGRSHGSLGGRNASNAMNVYNDKQIASLDVLWPEKSATTAVLRTSTKNGSCM